MFPCTCNPVHHGIVNQRMLRNNKLWMRVYRIIQLNRTAKWFMFDLLSWNCNNCTQSLAKHYYTMWVPWPGEFVFNTITLPGPIPFHRSILVFWQRFAHTFVPKYHDKYSLHIQTSVPTYTIRGTIVSRTNRYILKVSI